MLKRFFAGLLTALCLSAGLVAIGLERQAYNAEELVKTWTRGQCLMEELNARDESFEAACIYEVQGKRVRVRRQTPAWNRYFQMVRADGTQVEVLYRDSSGETRRFTFQKGQPAEFWFNPEDPEDSVLLPSSGSLRAFLYVGIGFYLALGILVGAAAWRRKRQRPSHT